MVNKPLTFLAAGLGLQACAVVWFGSPCEVNAGEKIIFSDSTGKTEGTKPAKTSEEISRRFNFIKRSSGPDFSAGEIAPPSVQPINPNLSRKLEDYLDQKKNWMFRPSTDQSTTMEERLGVRENSIFDSGAKGRRGAIETYWDNQEESKTKSKDKKPKSGEDSEFEREENPETEEQSSGLLESTTKDSLEQKDPREDSKDPTALTLDRYLNPANRMFGINDGLKENFGMSKFDFLPKTGSRDLDPVQKAEKQRLNDAHDADFQQMIQPRNLTPSIAGAFDPINSAKDQTRQESNPFQSFSVGINPSLGKSSLSPLQPSISASPLLVRPPSEVNLAESIGNRALIPSVSGSLIAPPVTSTFKTAPNPFVLEFPKRKF